MLLKKESQRLKNKNWRYYKGKPMFQWNLEKLLMVFDEVFVSSDCDKILDRVEEMGAFGIKRPDDLLDVPNIDCYKHAIKHTDADAFVAVQANSPETGVKLIKHAKDLLDIGHSEIKTCHFDGADYGSIWGMTKERLENHNDDKPSFWIKDFSIDIHTIEDLYRSYDNYKKYKASFK
jgi:hypothetical protein